MTNEKNSRLIGCDNHYTKNDLYEIFGMDENERGE